LKEDKGMSKKILIADDSLFMRNYLKDIIKGNYEFIEAETGAQAEALFKKEKPDLVILDIIMPEGEEEGLRVLKSIKEAAPGTDVIMVTAVGADSVQEECKKLGIQDYIHKPFDEEKVDKTIKKYLA